MVARRASNAALWESIKSGAQNLEKGLWRGRAEGRRYVPEAGAGVGLLWSRFPACSAGWRAMARVRQCSRFRHGRRRQASSKAGATSCAAGRWGRASFAIDTSVAQAKSYAPAEPAMVALPASHAKACAWGGSARRCRAAHDGPSSLVRSGR